MGETTNWHSKVKKNGYKLSLQAEVSSCPGVEQQKVTRMAL